MTPQRGPLWDDVVEASKPQFASVDVVVPRTASSIHPWAVGQSSIWLVGPSGPLDPVNIVYEVGFANN